MKKLVFACLILLAACGEQASMEDLRPRQEEQIIRNLPTTDREFLLQPLETALDDLRQVIENDPGLEEMVETADNRTLMLRMSGEDTAMMVLKLDLGYSMEKHLRFWDDDGELFMIETTIKRFDEQGNDVEKRAYRIYLEEGNVQLSAYGKVAFGDEPLPQNWVNNCPTQEELNYLLSVR